MRNGPSVHILFVSTDSTGFNPGALKLAGWAALEAFCNLHVLILYAQPLMAVTRETCRAGIVCSAI
jgi:hypothetical protein